MQDKQEKDVFLSHRVRSCGPIARELNELLQQNGLSTFICADFKPGDDFQEQIMFCCQTSKVMVVFADSQWEESPECQAEFKPAWGLWKSDGWPVIVPIMVGGLGWQKRGGWAKMIALSFQGIPLEMTGTSEQEINEQKKRCYEQVLEACRKHATHLNATSAAAIKAQITCFAFCELCGKSFQDPRQLPCTHSFCFNCLQTRFECSNANPTCPKCDVSCSQKIESLPPNVTANQWMEVRGKFESVSDEIVDDDLAKWFEDNKISHNARTVLRNSGYENLEIILSLEEEELKEINGIQPGHVKILWKSITKSKEQPKSSAKPKVLQALGDLDISLLDAVFDDRVLRSGNVPADSTKFWQGFTKKQKSDFLNQFRELGFRIQDHPKLEREEKANKLHRVAMVLCIAGLSSDAEFFAGQSMNLRKPNMKDEIFPKEYLESKVLKIYAMQNRLKQYKWITKETIPDWRANVMHCDDILSDEKGKLDKDMLCKVRLLKIYALRSLNARKFNHGSNEKRLLSETAALCKNTNEGLYAEYLMVEALMDQKNEKSRICKLLEARKACKEAYGEYSELMSRIYCNLGINFEKLKDGDGKEMAYECFRRDWIISQRLYGMHHAITVMAAQELESEVNKGIARRNGDYLPSDEGAVDVCMDNNVEERLKSVIAFK